jgi:hypothetical protein
MKDDINFRHAGDIQEEICCRPVAMGLDSGGKSWITDKKDA